MAIQKPFFSYPEVGMTNKYEVDMSQGNLFKKIVKFSFPLMIMGILQLFYNAADLIVVSRFSGDENALGAVGSTTPVISLAVNLFMGLSVGTNVICGRLFGAKKEKEMSKVVHTSILSALILGIMLSFLGILFADKMLHAMHNEQELSLLYLRIYFLSVPFNMIYNFAASILRAIGDTKRPLYFLSVSGIINVLLNLLFVIAFKMSVRGVALATVISQIISCIMIVATLMKAPSAYRLVAKKMTIDKESLREIIKIGLPAGIQSTLFSVSNVLVQAAINRFNPAVINGNAAAISVEGFIFIAMHSVYHANLAVTSQNLGARNVKNIKKSLLYSVLYVTVLSCAMGIITYLLGRPILSIYTKNKDAIEIGIIRLRYLCLPYFISGVMNIIVGSLRGLGFSLTPMIISVIGICGIRVLWIYAVFFKLTDFKNTNDLNILYLSYPVSWLITFVAQLICYKIVSKRKFAEIMATASI